MSWLLACHCLSAFPSASLHFLVSRFEQGCWACLVKESVKEANQSIGVKTRLDGETELSQDVHNLPNSLQVFLVSSDFRTKLETELLHDYSLK